MFSKEDVMEQLNQRAVEMKQKFSVRRIGLFGSLARDETAGGSDVDILVDFVEPTFDHYMDLKFYLEGLFGTAVDLVIADSVKPRLKPVIDKEVIYAAGL